MLVAVTTAIVLIQIDLLAMVLILLYCPKFSLYIASYTSLHFQVLDYSILLLIH